MKKILDNINAENNYDVEKKLKFQNMRQFKIYKDII